MPRDLKTPDPDRAAEREEAVQQREMLAELNRERGVRTRRDVSDLAEGEQLPEATLAELPESLKAAAARAGWTELMPVQAKAIPYLLAGRDLMVQARTGSGKTGAFLLPLLERLDPQDRGARVLVIVPTRELAKQVAREAEMLYGDSGFRTALVYGGVGYGPQIKAFRAGAQLVVGTPGRVLDHLIKGNLKLDGLEVLVFDEADRMMGMGFYPDMKELQQFLPREDLNAQMFSATFPPHVIRLAGEFLDEPEFLSLSHDRVHVAEVEHVYYPVEGKKSRALERIIEVERPTAALIFCNTKARVHYVAVVLQRMGYDADEISSDLSQKARERVMGRVRDGTLRFLVATDVAARGIDLPDLSHVFQYEPPQDQESYIHRAGRTGRAGASGVAVMLVDPVEQLDLGRISRRYDIEFEEREVPTEDEVAALVAERMTAALEAQLRHLDDAARTRLERLTPLAETLLADEDGRERLALLADRYYRDLLHAPVPVPSEGAADGRNRSLPPIDTSTDTTPDALAAALERRLEERDRLERARLERYERLITELSGSTEGRWLAALLLAYQAGRRDI